MTEPTRYMAQSSPWPDELEDLVSKCTYRKSWTVDLEHTDRGQGSQGLTLTITTWTVNSYRQDEHMGVRHLFIVPAAAYDRRSWQRWLFERFRDVESHEAAEFFTIDGAKPYAPLHLPGSDPYMIAEHASWEEVDTSFRGERNHPDDASGADS
jgi:hypothetical protein